MRRTRPSDETKNGFLSRRVTHALAFTVTLLLMGCSHLTSEVGPLLPSKPETLVIGTSRVGNVLDAVGPPSRISATAGGFAMFYEHNGVEENQLGFKFLRIFKFVAAKSWLDHQTWLVTFDTNGIVRGLGEEHWRKVLGRGAGAQILVTVSSLVDSSQVRRPAPQHDWGESWLVPLPKLLNSGQSLDNGSFGLEQTLSPSAVGQRTLEMTPPPRKFPKKK